MSDYTSTFTEGTGDTIDASDFSTEFDAIEAAIATKYESGDAMTGTFTGNLTGNVTGDVTGNADTATTATSITGNLTGDVTSSGMITTLTTATVGSKTAGLAVGSVGSYAMLRYNAANASPGNTVSGASLFYSNAGGTTSGSPSGTWRCMGYSDNSGAGSSCTLWLRIS